MAQKKVLIVESPTKAKKIEKFIGHGWLVTASAGHIRDLPSNEMGVSAPDFVPDYVIHPEKVKTVAWLRKIVKEADEVYLGTDLDREGEAIAWHLQQALKPKNYWRVTFNEITKKAILAAISSPRAIDINRVKAQEARRVLDRIFGYYVSPWLTKAAGIGTSLSAGRVQSSALLLIVMRERAIRDHVSIEHFRLDVKFSMNISGAPSGPSGTWTATWEAAPLFKMLEQEPPQHFTDKAFIDRLATAIQQQRGFTVQKVVTRKTYRKAPPPFTTSTLQQGASSRLKMNPDETMKLAQSLFDSGAITYHRTDSVNLSEEALAMIREFLTSSGQPIPDTPNTWESKESAQEAHEAIRPSDIEMRQFGDDPSTPAAQLYQLIWMRAVASQMTPATYDSTKAVLLSDVAIKGQNQPFLAKGRVLLDAGWMALTNGDDTEEPDTQDIEATSPLPVLVDGQRLTALLPTVETQKTQPPARLSLAGLVKEMERLGIGRPATYAATQAVLEKRSYMEVKSRMIHATDLGEAVADVLQASFSFIELSFTRQMEDALDQIATGKAGYKPVVSYQYNILQAELAAVSNGGSNQAFVDMRADLLACPVCADGIFVRKKGPSGHFYSCSRYPDCCASAPEAKAKRGEAHSPDLTRLKTGNEPKTEQILSEQNCPKCDKHKLALREGSRGPFWGCTGFKARPSCKAIVEDVDGVPDIENWVEKPKQSRRTTRPGGR